MNVIVDTSVWSLALRRAPHHLNGREKALVEELTELVNEGRARIIGPIRQELLSGIKTSAQFEQLRTNLRSFPDEALRTSDYEAAAEAGNSCRSKGITTSLVDILICSVAIDRGWHIFATDPDFMTYARVLPIQLYGTR